MSHSGTICLSRRLSHVVGACCLVLAGTSPLPGDVFHLASGGLVEGEWLNRDERPPSHYVVQTSAGVRLDLPLASVREVVLRSEHFDEYERRKAATPQTAAAQWELAEWCRTAGLAKERRAHLERVIALDPNHQRARGVLGFQFLHGEWVTRDAFRRQEGYEYYRGKWRTPQEIEVLEARARRELAEKEWLVKLRRWRQDLASERRQQAYEQLLAINDPVAVRPIAEFFSRERDRRVKMLYVDILANLNTSEAQGVLVERALGDADEEVFHYCLDKLADLQPPRVADAFIAALQDEYNARINRAGMALARLGDSSAISPLIDALITTHTHVLPGTPGTGANSTTTTFSETGAGLKQNEGPKVIVAHVQNQHVLGALNKLTGVNFGFDQRAWRYWHAQEKLSSDSRQAAAAAASAP